MRANVKDKDLYTYILLLTSKRGTTVAGGAFIKLAATMQTVRVLPLSGLGLLFGIDRLMATCTIRLLVSVLVNIEATMASIQRVLEEATKITPATETPPIEGR